MSLYYSSLACTSGLCSTALFCFCCRGDLVIKLCPTLATSCTVAYKAPLSMGFFRQEHWSGLPFPSPGDPSDPEIEPGPPALEEDSLPTELQGKPSFVVF